MLLVELLRPIRSGGYPIDYLLARLPTRRAGLLTSCPGGGGREARRELDRELDWFHGQLEPVSRRQLAPVLLFFELPGLLAALRFREAGDRSGVTACLKSSRLHRTIREILGTEGSGPETLKELGRILASLNPSLAGLERFRRERGRAGLEQAIVSGLLSAARREHPAGPIRDFLDQLAARQDLLRQAKAEKWPGKVSLAWRTRQIHDRSQHRFFGQPAWEDDPDTLDRRLLAVLARDWRRRSRTGGRLEQLLDYLWTCYLVARDCGVRQLTELLGGERVAAEVIL